MCATRDDHAFMLASLPLFYGPSLVVSLLVDFLWEPWRFFLSR